MDNATIHRANITKRAAVTHNIQLIFNAPYRPDLNGIEFLWRKAKTTYYRFTDFWRANGHRDWNQAETVRKSVEEISVELAKRCANKGWYHLANAQPIAVTDRPWESAPRMGNTMMVHWVTNEELAKNYAEAKERQDIDEEEAQVEA